MLRALALLLPCVQDPGDAAALLARTAAALERPLEVDFALTRTQALTWETHLAEGTLRVDPARDAWRVDLTVREMRAEDAHRVSVWRDGERFVFADHDARTFAEGDRDALGGLPSRLAAVAAGILPAPADALEEPRIAETLELAGRTCAKVVGRTADAREHAWYVDLEDALPRLWETDRDLGEGDRLRQRMTLRAVRAAEGALERPALAGYARVEPAAWVDPEARARAADFGVFTSLAGGLEPFRERFNADRGHVRAVGLFAPT